MHGKKNGKVWVSVYEVSQTPSGMNRRFCLTIVNEPGIKHARNLQLQANLGENHLLCETSLPSVMAAQIGCESSTFLGEKTQP